MVFEWNAAKAKASIQKHGVSFDQAASGKNAGRGITSFENEWQSFGAKKDRSLELTSVFHECLPGRRKPAVKVVDIFGDDTMTIVEVNVGGRS